VNPRHLEIEPSELLEQAKPFLQQGPSGPILDLACGAGRNTLWLARHGYRAIGCDRSREALAIAEERCGREGLSARFFVCDLEGEAQPSIGRDYAAVVVSRYLHRPLWPLLRSIIRPGGLIIYETFTIAQARLGRPRNPHFLLLPGELARSFDDWGVLLDHEGVSGTPPRATAQLIARKPEG
jgi:tellurite methyltransferase